MYAQILDFIYSSRRQKSDGKLKTDVLRSIGNSQESVESDSRGREFPWWEGFVENR